MESLEDFIEYLQYNFGSFWPIQTNKCIEYHDYFLNAVYTASNPKDFTTWVRIRPINEKFTPIIKLAGHAENIFSDDEKKLPMAERFKLYENVDLELFKATRCEIAEYLESTYSVTLTVEQYIKLPKMCCLDYEELPTFNNVDDAIQYIEHVYNEDEDYYKYFTFYKKVPAKFVQFGENHKLTTPETLAMLGYADIKNVVKNCVVQVLYDNIIHADANLFHPETYTVLAKGYGPIKYKYNVNPITQVKEFDTSYGIPYNIFTN